MKKKVFHPTFLKFSYLIIFSLLFSFIVYTPTLIGGPVNLNTKVILKQETIEGSLLCILFIMSILILKMYKLEVIKHKGLINKITHEKKRVEDRLIDTEKYIGILNVQIREIKSIFNSIDQFPEKKDDLKKAISFFGDRVFGIVNSKWVLFRIIDSNTQRTIFEHFATRHGFSYNYPRVSNKMVIEKQAISNSIYVISNPKNLNVRTFCIMPIDMISNDQHLFIQAILNEITKLFVICNSFCSKNENNILKENNPGKEYFSSGVSAIFQ